VIWIHIELISHAYHIPKASNSKHIQHSSRKMCGHIILARGGGGEDCDRLRKWRYSLCYFIGYFFKHSFPIFYLCTFNLHKLQHTPLLTFSTLLQPHTFTLMLRKILRQPKDNIKISLYLKLIWLNVHLSLKKLSNSQKLSLKKKKRIKISIQKVVGAEDNQALEKSGTHANNIKIIHL
jgi:hypothetical protein